MSDKKKPIQMKKAGGFDLSRDYTVYDKPVEG